MSIELPIEGLVNMVSGIPPGLFVAVAIVMAINAIQKLWGYVLGFLCFCFAMTHPAIVITILKYLVQIATQLSCAN